MARKPSLSRRSFIRRTAAVGGAMVAGSLAPSSALSAEASPAAAATDRWQIGCYTRPWDKFDYRVAMDAVADAGYKYIGLMTTAGRKPLTTVLAVTSTTDDAAKVADEAKKRGLQIPSAYCGGINASQRSTAAADFRHLVDLCFAAGAGSLLVAGTADARQTGNYYGGIADCCDYAAEKKVTLTVKPHGPLLISGQELRKVVKEVGRKNFSIYYDPGNIFHYTKGKLNPVDDVTAVDGLVTGLVVKDFSSKLPLEESVWLTPGTGDVDFAALLAKLKKGGFTGGPLLVETLRGRGNLPVLAAEAKKVRRFLEKLVS